MMIRKATTVTLTIIVATFEKNDHQTVTVGTVTVEKLKLSPDDRRITCPVLSRLS